MRRLPDIPPEPQRTSPVCCATRSAHKSEDAPHSMQNYGKPTTDSIHSRSVHEADRLLIGITVANLRLKAVRIEPIVPERRRPIRRPHREMRPTTRRARSRQRSSQLTEEQAGRAVASLEPAARHQLDVMRQRVADQARRPLPAQPRPAHPYATAAPTDPVLPAARCHRPVPPLRCRRAAAVRPAPPVAPTTPCSPVRYTCRLCANTSAAVNGRS